MRISEAISELLDGVSDAYKEDLKRFNTTNAASESIRKEAKEGKEKACLSPSSIRARSSSADASGGVAGFSLTNSTKSRAKTAEAIP